MKTNLSLLLACVIWIFGFRTAVGGEIYEFDFIHGSGSIPIQGYLVLDAPSGISGSAVDIASWDITADGLDWTPASSYIAPVTLGNDLTWDGSGITSLSIELTSYSSAPWYNAAQWGPQLLNLWGSGVNDGAGGGLTQGTWVAPAPEPQTVALLFWSILVWGGSRWLRSRRIQRNR